MNAGVIIFIIYGVGILVSWILTVQYIITDYEEMSDAESGFLGFCFATTWPLCLIGGIGWAICKSVGWFVRKL